MANTKLLLATCENCDMLHLVVQQDSVEVVSVPIPDDEWDKLFAAVGMAQATLRERVSKRVN